MVQQFSVKYAVAAERLQAVCFPPPFPENDLFKADHFRYNAQKFPEGQFMVVQHNQLVATANNLIVTDFAWHNLTTWKALVGGLEIINHDPSGTTLFGVDISVHPDFRKQGIAREIYRARIDLARKLNLKRFVTACRVPGLSQHPNLTPRQFMEEVIVGTLSDMPLNAFLKLGMTCTGIQEEFMPDPESRNCCAILEYSLS